MTRSSHRTTCKPFFQKLEILTLPSHYVLSLMRFLSTNLEIYTFNSSVRDINTRRKLNYTNTRRKLNYINTRRKLNYINTRRNLNYINTRRKLNYINTRRKLNYISHQTNLQYIKNVLCSNNRASLVSR
jgi:hypothetical protein